MNLLEIIEAQLQKIGLRYLRHRTCHKVYRDLHLTERMDDIDIRLYTSHGLTMCS